MAEVGTSGAPIDILDARTLLPGRSRARVRRSRLQRAAPTEVVWRGKIVASAWACGAAAIREATYFLFHLAKAVQLLNHAGQLRLESGQFSIPSTNFAQAQFDAQALV
jgi:hypothetical protein